MQFWHCQRRRHHLYQQLGGRTRQCHRQFRYPQGDRFKIFSNVQFLFGDGWGHDTVQVGDGLDFTLCFNVGMPLSVVYDDFGARLSCGNNSVAVMGVFSGIESHIAYGILPATH